MKKITLFTECAAFSAVLLFSVAGCARTAEPTDDALPVFAPVKTAPADLPPVYDDPLALLLPHEKIVYDVPPLPAAQSIAQTGTIIDAERRIGFYDDGTLREYARIDGIDKYYLLGIDGSRATDTPYLDITPVTSTVFAVTADKSTVNRVGLIKADGTVLIPCEAAAVIVPVGDADKVEKPRFVEVIFAEKRASDGEGAFFTRSDGLSYTGCALIYDLEKCRYVPHIRLAGSASYLPNVSKDRIAVRDEITGSTVLYTPDGSVDTTFSHLDDFSFGRDSYLAVSDGEYRVYESDGTATYVSDHALAIIPGEGRCYTEQTDGGVRIIDRFGNALFGETFAAVEEEYAGVIHAVTTDGTHILTDLTGNHLYETKDNVPKHLAHGIYECGHTVVLPDGSAFDAGAGDHEKLLFVNDADGAYCFSARDFTLPAGGSYAICEALLAVQSGNEYLLYDLYGGNILLNGGYGVIAEAYGCVYARNGNTVDVFVCHAEELPNSGQSLQSVHGK